MGFHTNESILEYIQDNTYKLLFFTHDNSNRLMYNNTH